MGSSQFTIDELQDAKIAPGVFMALEKIGIVIQLVIDKKQLQ